MKGHVRVGGAWKAFAGTSTPPPDPEDPPVDFTKYKPKIGWVDDGPLAGDENPSKTRVLTGDFATLAKADIFRHTVLNMGMKELVTVSGSKTTGNRAALMTAMKSVLDWNAANPAHRLVVHLRPHVGVRAPTAWKTECGTVTVTDVGFGKKGAVPKWYVQPSAGSYPYRELLRDGLLALADICADIDVIGSIALPGGAFFYPEPFLLLQGSRDKAPPDGTGLSNAEVLLANGYTDTEHKKFLTWHSKSGQFLKATEKVIYLDVNPPAFLTKAAQDPAFLPSCMDAHIDTLDKLQAGLENYSARQSFVASGGYLAMYKQMVLRPAWTNIQLARSPRVADVTKDGSEKTHFHEVAQVLYDMGMLAIEDTGPRRAGDDPYPDGGMKNGYPQDYIPLQTLLLRQTNQAYKDAATWAAGFRS